MEQSSSNPKRTATDSPPATSKDTDTGSGGGGTGKGGAHSVGETTFPEPLDTGSAGGGGAKPDLTEEG